MTQPGNIAKAGLVHFVTGKAAVDASFEGPFAKRRVRPSEDRDPELGHGFASSTSVHYLLERRRLGANVGS